MSENDKHVPVLKGPSQEEGPELKSWREMIDVSIARSRKIKGSNYVQIATVDPVGYLPSVRTVVFRGFSTITNSNIVSVAKPKDPIQEAVTSKAPSVVFPPSMKPEVPLPQGTVNFTI